MKKMDKFFTTSLVTGLIIFSAALAIRIQTTEALINTNDIADNAITSPKIKDFQVRNPDIASSALQLKMHFVRDSIVIEVGQARGLNVNCPSGEQVTGGGYNTMPDMPVYINDPHETQQGIAVGWSVAAKNNGIQPQQLAGFVMCAQRFP
jgi:hypothetical protein